MHQWIFEQYQGVEEMEGTWMKQCAKAVDSNDVALIYKKIREFEFEVGCLIPIGWQLQSYNLQCGKMIMRLGQKKTFVHKLVDSDVHYTFHALRLWCAV